MGKTTVRALSPLHGLKLLILLGAGLATAWFVILAGVKSAFPARSTIAQRLNPDNPALVFRRAIDELIATRGKLSDETISLTRLTARKLPLSAEPFFFEGIQALILGDLKRGEELLLEARARHPRHRLVRISLISIYIQTGRVGLAAQEIAAATRLIEAASQILVPELAKLAAAPATSQAVIDAVGADPLMDGVLNHLAAQRAKPALLERLAARRPTDPSRLQPWQSAVLQRALDQREFSQAFDLWKQFAQIGDDQPSLIYDPLFQGKPGGPPFNWELQSSKIGVAEAASGAGLSVNYFGREPGILASQLLLLSPGRYRFSFRVEGSAKEGLLSWELQCVGGRSPLLGIRLEAVTYAPKDIAGELTIPSSGCPAQWLRLQAIPAEYPTTQSVKISRISMAKVPN